MGMAFAKKCDRCGVYYEKNAAQTKAGSKVGGVAFICTYGTTRYILDHDLCDECMDKFM